MSSPLDGSDPGPPQDPLTPPQPPWSFNPYDPNPYGAPGAPGRPPTDGVSIAAMVCSLTCCAGPVGIGLAIAGIVRTKDGRRSGRWAALTGLAVGIVATLALVGGGIGLVWYGTSTVFIEDARAGDCLDVGEVDFWQRDCDEPHDAEVVHAARFDGALVSAYVDTEYGWDFCAPLAAESGYGDLVAGNEHTLDVWVDSDDVDRPEVGDHFICLAESADGDELDGALPQGEPTQAVGSARWWSDLQVGDCLNDPSPAGDSVTTVYVVDCTEEHDFQHIGQVQVYGADWPGEAAVEKRTEACLDRFETYLRISFDESSYDLTYYTPTEESWPEGAGGRLIVCLGAGEPGEKLTETLKGIAE